MFSQHTEHPRVQRACISPAHLARAEALWGALGEPVFRDETIPETLRAKAQQAFAADDLWRPLLEEIRRLLQDRARGACVIEYHEPRPSGDALAAFVSFALAHGVGTILPEDRNTDGLPRTGTDFVFIGLRSQKSYNPTTLHFNDPRRAWPVHTDRCLHDDPGDYLLVCKYVEESASGGRIRLLHIDDFVELEHFANHPLARVPLGWKGDERLAPLWQQAQARREPEVKAPVFSGEPGSLCVRFTDFRFRRPRSVEQAEYLEKLGEALYAQAESIPDFELPVSGIYLVNNRWYLHGRSGFVDTGSFRRQLLRYCGNFNG